MAKGAEVMHSKDQGDSEDSVKQDSALDAARWLDNLRESLQRFREPRCRKASGRYCEASPGAQYLWRELHRINGLHPEGSMRAQDCLVGIHNANCSPLVPYDEADMTSAMLYLRAIGAISSDPVEADKWKRSIFNQIPMIPPLGALCNRSQGGLLVVPTKKCLWRMCLFGLKNLYERAIDQNPQNDPNHPWRKFKASNLIEGWHQRMEGPLRLRLPDADAEGFEEYADLGTMYYATFRKDYESDELSITAKFTAKEAKSKTVAQDVEKEMTVNIFETRFTLIKFEDGQEDGAAVDLPRHKSKKQGPLKTYVWEPKKEGEKIIPNKAWERTTAWDDNDVATVTKKDLKCGGPVRFVPLDAVPLVTMFWHEQRRLRLVEGYRLDDQDQEFKETIDLAELFLQLCQCTQPDQVCEIVLPPFFSGHDRKGKPAEDKLPERPKKIELCKVFNADRRDLKEEQLKVEDIILKRWNDYKMKEMGNWTVYKDKVNLRAFQQAQKPHGSRDDGASCGVHSSSKVTGQTRKTRSPPPAAVGTSSPSIASRNEWASLASPGDDAERPDDGEERLHDEEVRDSFGCNKDNKPSPPTGGGSGGASSSDSGSKSRSDSSSDAASSTTNNKFGDDDGMWFTSDKKAKGRTTISHIEALAGEDKDDDEDSDEEAEESLIYGDNVDSSDEAAPNWDSASFQPQRNTSSPDEVNTLHFDPEVTLDELDCRIRLIAFHKERRFDEWVKAHGLSKALNMQRNELPGGEDEAEIDRLRSLMDQIESEKHKCSGQCLQVHMDNEDAMDDEEGAHQSMILRKVLALIWPKEAQYGSIVQRAKDSASRQLDAVKQRVKPEKIDVAQEDHSDRDALSPADVARLQASVAKRPRFMVWRMTVTGRPSRKEPKPYHEPSKQEKGVISMKWAAAEVHGESEKHRNMNVLCEKLAKAENMVARAAKVAKGVECSHGTGSRDSDDASNNTIVSSTVTATSSDTPRLLESPTSHSRPPPFSLHQLDIVVSKIFASLEQIVKTMATSQQTFSFSQEDLTRLAEDCVALTIVTLLCAEQHTIGNVGLLQTVRYRLLHSSPQDRAYVTSCSRAFLDSARQQMAKMLPSPSGAWLSGSRDSSANEST